MQAHAKDIRTAKNGVEMQHRHFAFIAANLKVCKPSESRKEAFTQWQDMVRCFMNTCSASNPRFDTARFLAACDCEFKS